MADFLLYYRKNDVENHMNPNYRRFLDALAGIPGDPVLFEPFVPVYLTEQLIWRRGEHLWSTVPVYLDTLLSLRERTYADVVIADMRRFPDTQAEELAAEMAAQAADEYKFVALCSSPLQYKAAVGSAGVCAVGLYGWENWFGGMEKSLPLIAMDGEIDAAVRAGFDGWFCPADGETYWEKYHDRISICGGLGAQWMQKEQPITIHNRSEAIFKKTGGAGWLIGSGGEVSKEDYLSLISLLGIYRRYR